MVDGGKPLDYLTRIREHYPMVMHGVTMSIGSTVPLNFDYLKQLKELIKRVEPKWISAPFLSLKKQNCRPAILCCCDNLVMFIP